eukprot:gene8248-9813_t
MLKGLILAVRPQLWNRSFHGLVRNRVQLKLELPAPKFTVPALTFSTKPRRELNIKPNQYYSGQILNGRWHGEGVLKYNSGDEHKGFFKYGLRDGPGTLVTASGVTYVGSFTQDKLNGQSKITYADGSIYEGEVVDFAKEGAGTLKYPSNETLSGEYKNDKIYNGEGIVRLPDGSSIQGKWWQGRKVGIFTVTSASGEKCVQGDFTVRGKLNGKGKEVDDEGNFYLGEYVDGLKHGAGVFTWEDGTTLRGEYKEDKLHGKCVLVDTEGKEHHIEYAEGVIVSADPSVMPPKQ